MLLANTKFLAMCGRYVCCVVAISCGLAVSCQLPVVITLICLGPLVLRPQIFSSSLCSCTISTAKLMRAVVRKDLGNNMCPWWYFTFQVRMKMRKTDQVCLCVSVNCGNIQSRLSVQGHLLINVGPVWFVGDYESGDAVDIEAETVSYSLNIIGITIYC